MQGVLNSECRQHAPVHAVDVYPANLAPCWASVVSSRNPCAEAFVVEGTRCRPDAGIVDDFDIALLTHMTVEFRGRVSTRVDAWLGAGANVVELCCGLLYVDDLESWWACIRYVWSKDEP